MNLPIKIPGTLTPQKLLIKSIFGKLQGQGIKKIVIDLSADDFDLQPMYEDDIIVKKSRHAELLKIEQEYLTTLKK